jgi:hypothetical protein
MATALREKNGGIAEAEEWRRSEGPMITWWTAPAVQASRLVTAASFYPVLAAWEMFRLTCATVSGLGAGPADSREDLTALLDTPRASSPVPGMSRADLAELASALQEYEETRGDWSKAR